MNVSIYYSVNDPLFDHNVKYNNKLKIKMKDHENDFFLIHVPIHTLSLPHQSSGGRYTIDRSDRGGVGGG